MKYKLKYSPDSRDKLKELSRRITNSNGKAVSVKVVGAIMSDIRGLQDNPQKGLSVEAMLGIPTTYRFLHVKQNYVFYRMEQDTVYIADIYNEREDFMWRMFRVNLRTQDSIDFWGE